ncbi:MAG TPA: restriction endonuclease subunit S [Dokdonella sp.]|jgi:type I restriction enzyme S subunit|nr:restriction endonuclease subunit S [Dokdonella sp.]
MSSDTRVPLSSVAEIVSVKVPVSSLGGHPYVSTENLLPNLGGLGEGALPDADRVNSFNKHDTLFSNIRPYFRKVHYAPTGGGCSADVLVFRTKDPQEFWPPYLYYCLADPTFIEHTMATCKGAKMPRGDKGAMLQYLVPKPDLDAQKKVSSLLRSLDESITALQQQNTALESIAQRLFRSWFVNFDPVHAKAAGKEPEAMSAELAALFPSEFEDSELGPIPKGWSVTTFGECLAHTIGGDWGKDALDEKHTQSVRVIRGTDIPDLLNSNSSTVPRRFVQPSKFKQRMLQPYDLVVEVSGGSKDQSTGRSLLVTRSMLSELGSPSVPTSFCRLFRPTTASLGVLLGCRLKWHYDEGHMWGYQVQSTGIANFQTTFFLANDKMAMPPEALLVS